MSWEKVKNWVFGGAGAVALVIFYQFMQWQVSVEVSKQLSAQDLATDSKIVSMDDNIQANGLGVTANKERGETTQRQLEQVAKILMQPPD